MILAISASLYGDKKKYTEGAIRVAENLLNWKHDIFKGYKFIIYHDNSVP